MYGSVNGDEFSLSENRRLAGSGFSGTPPMNLVKQEALPLELDARPLTW
jgi:hypothetical protein